MSKTVEVNRTDIEKLLDYVREAELEDFENTEISCRSGHIYKVIRKLDKLVEQDCRLRKSTKKG